MTFNNSSKDFMGTINGTYIPYNCQFLLTTPDKNSSYEILEMFNINYRTLDFSTTHFGTWNKTKELDVPISDFYSRRRDVNGSVFGVSTFCSPLGKVRN